jgi:hypothetical protein
MMIMGDAHGKFESDDDGNAVAALTMPNFWWMALDLSTVDMMNMMNTLRGEWTWKGRQMRTRSNTSNKHKGRCYLYLHFHDPKYHEMS